MGKNILTGFLVQTNDERFISSNASLRPIGLISIIIFVIKDKDGEKDP